jgi:hypothetical protein
VDPGVFDGDVAALREHVRGLISAEKQRLDREATTSPGAT